MRHSRRFDILESGGVQLAAAAARNRRVLRARGRTVRNTIDCLIAAFCMVHDHAWLHQDRDFDPFEELPGLSVLPL